MTGKATPAKELELQIMSSMVPKNEREHWAAREIARLRAELATANAEWEKVYSAHVTAEVELAAARDDKTCKTCEGWRFYNQYKNSGYCDRTRLHLHQMPNGLEEASVEMNKRAGLVHLVTPPYFSCECWLKAEAAKEGKK